MLGRWLFKLLFFTSLPMFYGCGTVRNFESPNPQPGRPEAGSGGLIGPPGGQQIYGGVRFDLVGFEMLVDPFGFPMGNLLGAYLIAVDLPLSFITDTLTLPWTIGATRSRVNGKDSAEPGPTRSAHSAADPVTTP